MRAEMYLAMRELLGSGYVPDYYEQAAAPFIQIAEEYKGICGESCEPKGGSDDRD